MILRRLIPALLFVSTALGVVVHETTRFTTPVRLLRGKVVDYGNVNPDVRVEIYDNAQVWSDDSLSLADKRKRQARVATTQTDAKGRWHVARLPKGLYEVQFSREGWDVLSVLVNVDPNENQKEQLCVTLRVSGAAGQNAVVKCR